jgi:hypothetical protein
MAQLCEPPKKIGAGNDLGGLIRLIDSGKDSNGLYKSQFKQ